MAFRLFGDQRPVFFDNSGLPLASGTLTFSNSGTSTARNVYGEKALSTNNGAVLTLNSTGRTAVDVWMTGSYRVVLKDSGGVVIDTADNVEDPTNVFPSDTGKANYFLQASGAGTQAWASVRQVPDPGGSAGKVLTNDGTLLSWTNQLATTTYTSTSLPGGVLQSASTFTIGKECVKRSTGSAATTGTKTVTAAVVFTGTAYTGVPQVMITPTIGGCCASGAGAITAAVSPSTAGFTATFISSDLTNITSAVTFGWVAIGTVA